jgi:quercetin dioxygenase-like cupin family protein
MKRLVIVLLLATQCILARERKADSNSPNRKVAPTWLHRYVPAIRPKPADISTGPCHYKPVFGAGDSDPGAFRSVVRYGEVTIDPNGGCKQVSYPSEEQIYFILEGRASLRYGEKRTRLHKDDFVYIPPGIARRISAGSDMQCRLVIMGFRIPPGEPVSRSAQVELANALDVKEQTDVGHPQSVLYRLLLGNRKGTHDKIDSGIVVTSLFLMDFAPGGTNLPHRHEVAEEIYWFSMVRG